LPKSFRDFFCDSTFGGNKGHKTDLQRHKSNKSGKIMAAKASVTVRERKLPDGRIRVCYDIYSGGQRELRTDEPTLYILPTDSAKMKAAKRAKAELTAQELKLVVMKDQYKFRKPKAAALLEIGSIGIDTYPTFLSLFEAEAARRSAVLAETQAYKAQQGRQVHKKAHDDVYYCLQRFKSFLSIKGKTDLHYQEFNSKLLEQFKNYLLAEVRDSSTKFCKNTAAAYLKKLKTVALLAYKEGLLTSKAANSVPYLKTDEFERKYLTKDHISILLDDLRANPTDTLFKRAFLFCCMVSLRFGDLATITWGHIQEGKLVFKPGKTEGKELRLKLNSAALALAGERQNDSQVIFPVKYSSALNDKLNLWILGNGIRRGRITWHSGRHSCATMLLRKTKNVVLVQKALGHANIATTLLYAKLESEELDNAMDSIDIENFELPETEF
jgi:integrase